MHAAAWQAPLPCRRPVVHHCTASGYDLYPGYRCKHWISQISNFRVTLLGLNNNDQKERTNAVLLLSVKCQIDSIMIILLRSRRRRMTAHLANFCRWSAVVVRKIHLLTLWPLPSTFNPKTTSFLGCPKVILYTKFEQFGIIRPELRRRQTNRRTDGMTDLNIHSSQPPVGVIVGLHVGQCFWCYHHDRSHFKSSLGSYDECRTAPSGCRSSDHAYQLGLRVHLCGLADIVYIHAPSPFIITRPESWYTHFTVPVPWRGRCQKLAIFLDGGTIRT